MSAAGPTSGPGRADDPTGDVLTAWALAIGLAYLAWRVLPEGAAWIGASLVWCAVPLGMVRWRGGSWSDLGLSPRSLRRSAAWTIGVALVVLPVFALGYYGYARLFMRAESFSAPPIAALAQGFGFHLVRAGIPEELFFRGYVQPQLEKRFPEAPRLLLIRNAYAVSGAALLFALTHVVFEAHPFSLGALARLTTFFPGLLFGLLRERTGEVWSPACFHALCNAWLFWLSDGLA